MTLVFWMLSFKPTFSLSCFQKRLFSSSSLSAIRVVSSAYLRLLIFLPAILIPAYASSSPMFLMMYSAYKLNKQGDNIQSWRTPFPIWNQSFVSCPVLTVASWPAYKVSQEADQVIWYFHLFQNFPQFISSVKLTDKVIQHSVYDIPVSFRSGRSSNEWWDESSSEGLSIDCWGLGST